MAAPGNESNALDSRAGWGEGLADGDYQRPSLTPPRAGSPSLVRGLPARCGGGDRTGSGRPTVEPVMGGEAGRLARGLRPFGPRAHFLRVSRCGEPNWLAEGGVALRGGEEARARA